MRKETEGIGSRKTTKIKEGKVDSSEAIEAHCQINPGNRRHCKCQEREGEHHCRQSSVKGNNKRVNWIPASLTT
jgi:hypothetical protein